MSEAPRKPQNEDERRVGEAQVLRDDRSLAWLLVLPLIAALPVLWLMWLVRNPPPIYVPLPSSDEHLCNEGDQAHCVDWAATMDDEHALPVLHRSCERGHADACHAGALRSPTHLEALLLARAACDKGHPEGCVLLATLELRSCAELGGCDH